MAIELPRVLKNMNLFVDGRGYAGRIDEIQLPKLTLKTEEHRAIGMDGDRHLVCIAGQRLVDRVVDDFEHHVVQAGAIIGVADIHARTLAYCVKTLQDLDFA